MNKKTKILSISIILNIALLVFVGILFFQRDIYINDNITINNTYPSMNTVSSAKKNQIVVDVFAHFPSLVTFAKKNTWYAINDYLHKKYKLSLPLIVWNPFLLTGKTAKLNYSVNKLLSIKNQVKVRANSLSMKDIKQYWGIDNLNGKTKWQAYLSILKTYALKRWTPSLVNNLINQLK